MEEKYMQELNLDEMDKVSGGSGRNPVDITSTCECCDSKDIEPIFWWSGGSVRYKCNECGYEWVV